MLRRLFYTTKLKKVELDQTVRAIIEEFKSSFDISFRFYGTRISISFRSKNGSIFISGIEIINQNRSDSLERSNITDAIIS